MEFEKIVISGTPEDRGFQYGSKCRELIQLSIANYKKWMESEKKRISWDEARRRSLDFLPAIQRSCRSLGEEMNGIAKGAEVEFEDILTLNCRSEVVSLIRGIEDVDGCSSIGVLPERSLSGHTLLAQNWDMYHWVGDVGIVLEILEDDGPDILTVTEAGQLSRYGINKSGCALGVTSLHNIKTKVISGLPSVLIRRKFLMQSKYNYGVNAILKNHHMVPMHYLTACGDAPGCILGLDGILEGTGCVYPQNGLYLHTNHMLHPSAPLLTADKGGTLYRLRILEAILNKEKISIEDIKMALSHHFGFPTSVCRHCDPKLKEIEQVSTLGSMVMDVTDKRLWACKRNPCENDYIEFGWSRK